jgi:SAM-dependent methyltransferase
MKKNKFSVAKKLILDTMVAIRNVGALNTSKLYISALIDRLFYHERMYDINKSADPRDTIPNHPNVDHATIYIPTREGPFLKMLDALNLDKDNTVFIDFGCGKGRALMLAAKHGIKKIKGIEFCEQLSSIALSNLQLYSNKNRDIDYVVINDDMSLYNIDDSDNLFYFYNPCDEYVLNKVISNIINSFSRVAREGMIIYQNNTINLPTIFDNYKEFHFISCKEFSGNKFFIYEIK